MTPTRFNPIAATLLTLAVFVPPSHAIVRHNGANDQDYIDYGNQFPSTGYMLPYLGAQAYWGGSAVVIDDGHWVLTSAHVVLWDNYDPLSFYDSYSFGTGDNALSDPGDLFQADQVFLPGDYSEPVRSADLALLYFEDPIIGVTPAQRCRGDIEFGTVASIVGSGLPGTPSTGYQDTDFQRRGCQSKLNHYGSGSYPEFSVFAYFRPPEHPDYLPLGGIGGPGDSGGGWYNEAGDLVGITSGGHGPDYHGYSIAMDITYFNPWIDDIQASVPEPATLVLLSICGLTTIMRRNRKAA